MCRNSKEIGYDIQEKIVILVEDRAATGDTILIPARWIRKQNPKKLVIAIPITTKNTLKTLKKECDLI